MKISVSEAKAKLADLVRQAEAGEDVILTRHGRDLVRLVPLLAAVPADARRRVIAAARRSTAAKRVAGALAARSQDDLHDDDGMPL